MKKHPLAAYFVLAYCASWVVWAPAVLARLGWIGPVSTRPAEISSAPAP